MVKSPIQRKKKKNNKRGQPLVQFNSEKRSNSEGK